MINIPKLLLVSFDEKDNFITDLVKSISAYLEFEIDISETERPKFIHTRGIQKYAGDFLSTLEWLRKKGGYDYTLGVVSDDLYVPKLNFVFGVANASKGAAIISIHRLQSKEYDFFLRRTLTESIHELGHLFGLKHCNDPNCVMFFSNSLQDTDRKGYRFCSRCADLFEKRFGYKPRQKDAGIISREIQNGTIEAEEAIEKLLKSFEEFEKEKKRSKRK